MKKFLLSFLVIFIFIIYFIHKKTESVVTSQIAPVQKNIFSPSISPSISPSTSSYMDGSYTGDVVDAYYGNVQVQASIQNGKVVDVKFLQYPNDRSTSIEINSQAMPYLTQEAIQAQNAQIDVVSGATYTSEAFIQSLASALIKAKK